MLDISRIFVLIKDGGDHSRKDFWVHLVTLEGTQVFTGICVECVLLLFKSRLINLGYGFKYPASQTV